MLRTGHSKRGTEAEAEAEKLRSWSDRSRCVGGAAAALGRGPLWARKLKELRG
jgi:hypothetical protein